MVTKLLFLPFFFVLCKGLDVDNLKLKQVLIFSRHNVRYPLGKHLLEYSPKFWSLPAGSDAGDLTPRGALLEGYMGEYFSQWFHKEQFLPEGCPDEDTVYVYANTKNRTKGTARAFLNSAFKTCNIKVHHKNITEPDPLFEPVIHNTTDAYREMVFEVINSKLQNNLKLRAAYQELNKILDIENSHVCKQGGICDLTEANNTILYEVGKEVWVSGPLSIGNSALDAFIMSYYNGMPLQDIAWGQITTPEKWKLLTEIGRQDQMIRYETVAQDIGAQLLEYITNIFKNYDEMPKLMMIFGHDYNINSLTVNMGFESIDLPNQFEKFPIGSKLVFQRWDDGENDYLKIEYVYSSWSQFRFGTKFSLENPPQRVVMRLNWCETDINGFCPWNEFINKL